MLKKKNNKKKQNMKKKFFLPPEKKFSTTSNKKLAELAMYHPAVLAQAGLLFLYPIAVALISTAIFLCSYESLNVPVESTALANEFISLIGRVISLSERIPSTDIEGLTAFLALLRWIISSFEPIINVQNIHLEQLDTMSAGYDIYFRLISTFEDYEAYLRTLYRGTEVLLNIPIQETELIPNPSEAVFENYVAALGGNPEEALAAHDADMDID